MTGHDRAPPWSAGRGRYHHGDLREALIQTAVELLGERGAHAFSMAEASRRLGVADRRSGAGVRPSPLD